MSGTFTRHLLQNLSPGLIGLPQALQTRPPVAVSTGAGAAYCDGGGGGGWYTGGGGTWIAGTVAEDPQIPQNFTSGVVGEPQLAQTSAGGWDAGTGAGAAMGAGAGAGVWYAGAATGAGAKAAGTGAGASPLFAPQLPQNFSSGASDAPQERHRRFVDGGAGGVAGAGDSSMSDAPQERQNFCEMPTLLPHSGQNGME